MKRPFKVADVAQLRIPTNPVVSPDGRRIVYVLTGVSGDAKTSSIWLQETAGGEPRRLTNAGLDSSPAWHGSGDRLSFLRSVAGAPDQLWSVDIYGGEPAPVTSPDDFPRGVGNCVWSPDGRTLFFCAPTHVTGVASTANEPIVATRLDYKNAQDGYRGSFRSHIFGVNPLDGKVRQVTDGDWNAGEPAISADGSKLAFTAAREADYDTAGSSHIWYVDLNDVLLTVHRLGDVSAITGPLLWNRDSTAVIGVGRATPNGGREGLWRVSLDGTKPDENLSMTLDRSVISGSALSLGGRPQMTADGDILFCVRVDGGKNLYRHNAMGLHEVLDTGRTVVAGLSHNGGTTAAVIITPDTFGEIAVIADDGHLTVLTSLTKALPDVELFTGEQRSFLISSGETVTGWLIRDVTRQDGPAPLLLDIPGGQHTAWAGVADAAHPYHQELASNGWNILLLNPRANGDEPAPVPAGAWDTLEDNVWMEPLDQLIAEGIADPDRLAVTGYGLGGFATCALTSITSRFSAAVAGALIADFSSVPGSSDLFGFPAGTDDSSNVNEASRLFPLAGIHNVKTPTLILHGENDLLCPVSQAERWFAGLRMQGVPTTLVIYPGQSHSFIADGAPSHRKDYSERLIAWLELHVPVKDRPAVALDVSYWQRRLDRLLDKYEVPGAVFGVLRTDAAPGRQGEQRCVVASGVANMQTGQPVTKDTLFQLGSISKTWTATLVMQLVAEGKLDLDAPIRDVLPNFHLADESAAAVISMRQLLTHTSGIDGDIFIDTGRGDDCVERYVDALNTAEQLFTPGHTWSYCNTGFVIAGRVVEVLRGMSWDAALEQYIRAPLGLAATTTLPEQTVLHGFAVGHKGLGGERAVATQFLPPRSLGPAGLITSSADDTLSYARSFLRGGSALLPERELAEMLSSQVDMRFASTAADEWAIGWCLEDWGGVPTINHNGATLGQNSYLRLFPQQGIVLFLSVNGGRAESLHQELFTEAGQLLAGATMPAAFSPQNDVLAGDRGKERLDDYAGVYEAAGLKVIVEPNISSSSGDWQILATDTSGLPTEEGTQILRLTRSGNGYLGAQAPDTPDWIRISFEQHRDTRLMHFGARAYPQISSDTSNTTDR